MKKLRFIAVSIFALALYLNFNRVQSAFSGDVMNVQVLPMEEIELLCEGKEEVFMEPCVTLEDVAIGYDRGQNMLLIPQSLQKENFQGRLSVPDGKLYFLEEAAFENKAEAISQNQIFRLFWITEEQCWMYNVYFTGMPIMCLSTEAEEDEESSGTVRVYDPYRSEESYSDMECTWHLRGNSTRYYDKPSYRLSLTGGVFPSWECVRMMIGYCMPFMTMTA